MIAPDMIGQSPAFLDMMDQLARVAPLDRPVLLIGERGTGKELAAARLHFLSRRWDAPYLELNCAALPRELLDSELFGVEPGAFTDARTMRRGRFERADSGTLFLDEIANADLATQEKLLRAVEYGQIERLGGQESLEVDVRLIGATNVDLPARAAEGAFRQDLLDRLAFDVITLPPLRARGEDILLLADHFGRAMAIELDWEDFPGFNRDAETALQDFQWPGNVRELKNVVERAVYRHDDPTQPIDAISFDPFASPWRVAPATRPTATAGPTPSAQADSATPALPVLLNQAVANLETSLVQTALQQAKFNQRAAADLLGLNYNQIRHLIRKHEISA